MGTSLHLSSIGARLALAGIWFALGLYPGRADAPITVTVTHRAPMETLSATGEPSGVSEATVGTHYTFVSAEGSTVVLQDAQGKNYRMGLSATDYQPAAPVPPPVSVTSTTSEAAATNNVPAAPLPPPPALPTSAAEVSAAATPAAQDAVAKINAGLGTPLFTTQSLWKESSILIASRLGLKLEDKTKWETAYRRYFFDRESRNYEPAAILGGSAYCVALYADANDLPTSALIAFTNDGDYKGVELLRSEIQRLQHSEGAGDESAKRIADLQAKVDGMRQAFEPERQAEAATLTRNLTALFGDAKPTTFGSNVVSRERALRWDWNDVSFLLTGQENKYNLLRIIPTALADNHGRTDESVAKKWRPSSAILSSTDPTATWSSRSFPWQTRG